MKSKMKQTGFTLIELVIATAIVGILASVAIGSYSNNITIANRTDGRAVLLDNATVLEKCKAIYGVYNNNCSLISSSLIDSKELYYQLTVTTLTSSTFTLTSTPVAGGPQASDTDCTTMTLTHLGVQGGTGASSSDCW